MKLPKVLELQVIAEGFKMVNLEMHVTIVVELACRLTIQLLQ